MQEIRQKIEFNLPQAILALNTAFNDVGYSLYVVGGAVRDAVLGTTPKDFDLATNALPDEVLRLIMTKFPSWSADLTGKAFGVVRVMPPKNDSMYEYMEFEIATFRKDLTDGRHPVVEFTNIHEDVQRRDLTINAMYYDINSAEVIDVVGGLEDLRNKTIRMVGSAAMRFAEDKLRILRAIRFAAKFNYNIDKSVDAVLLFNSDISSVSPERIREEFLKGIILAYNVPYFFSMITRYGMWKYILGDLKVNYSRLIKIPRNYVLALAMMLCDNKDVNSTLHSLRYSDVECRQIQCLIDICHMTMQSAYSLRKAVNNLQIEDRQIYELLRMGLVKYPEVVRNFRYYRYMPAISAGPLVDSGYSGAALGIELRKRELLLFSQIGEYR